MQMDSHSFIGLLLTLLSELVKRTGGKNSAVR